MSVDNCRSSSAKEEKADVELLSSLPRLSPRSSGDLVTTLKEGQIELKEDITEQTSATCTRDSRPDDNDYTTTSTSKETNEERTWKRKRRIHFCTLCWVFILEGWNDSSLGPLLPAIQQFYRVEYAVVSLIFFFLCIGYLLGAIANVYMIHRFDFGKTIVLGTLGQIVAYTIIISAPPSRLKTRKELYAASGVTMQDNSDARTDRNKYRQLCGIRAVYLLSLFAFAYIGIEITIGGWTVTYLIHRTGAGSSAGFVSSGFFAGLALGRVLLLWVNQKVGPRSVIFLYASLAIVLEAIIWAVPHFITSAVLVSLVGMLLGPMFPILMNQCGNFFPPHLLSGGIGSVVGFGAIGGALLPFVTGVLADRFGVTSMQPLIIAVMVFLIAMWAGAVYTNRGQSINHQMQPATSLV